MRFLYRRQTLAVSGVVKYGTVVLCMMYLVAMNGFDDVFIPCGGKRDEEKRLEKQGKKNCCIVNVGMYAVWRSEDNRSSRRYGDYAVWRRI